MKQYCFARWHLLSLLVVGRHRLSSSVALWAGGLASRPPGAWAVGRPTIHGGPVWLRLVSVTPCLQWDVANYYVLNFAILPSFTVRNLTTAIFTAYATSRPFTPRACGVRKKAPGRAVYDKFVNV